MAVIKSAGREPLARRFIAFINGSQGRTIMREYGFVLLGGPPAGR